MYWLIRRKSRLTAENKLLLYKFILKPIWTYGIQRWGCAKPSITKILQRIQSKMLCIAFNAPWYINNKTLQDDSGIPPVEDEIKRLTNNYIHNSSILWNNQQMRQCAVKFISLRVHSTCFGRYTRPSSGVQF